MIVFRTQKLTSTHSQAAQPGKSRHRLSGSCASCSNCWTWPATPLGAPSPVSRPSSFCLTRSRVRSASRFPKPAGSPESAAAVSPRLWLARLAVEAAVAIRYRGSCTKTLHRRFGQLNQELVACGTLCVDTSAQQQGFDKRRESRDRAHLSRPVIQEDAVPGRLSEETACWCVAPTKPLHSISGKRPVCLQPRRLSA